PVVEHVVAHEIVEKTRDAIAKLRALRLELRQRLRETMCDLYVTAVQLLYELDIVVPGDGERGASVDHRHHESEHVGDSWPTVDQVADENRLGILGMTPDAAAILCITQLAEELLELGSASVNVADDIERPVVEFAVVPQRLSLDRNLGDLGFRLEH